MIALWVIAWAAEPDEPTPRERCAAGALSGCLEAMGEASRLRAWSDEPVPVSRAYDVEVYAARACLLGEARLCGFAEPLPERSWRHLAPGWTWVPGTPVALPGGGWTPKVGAALGFGGHRLSGDVVGTGSGLLVVEDGALALHDPEGRHPVELAGEVCRLEARPGLVRVGLVVDERCEAGSVQLSLDAQRVVDGPVDRRRPRQVTMDNDTVIELTPGELLQRTTAGEVVQRWTIDTRLPQHLLPHPDGLSVAVVQANGALIVPLVDGFGDIQAVPEWLPRPEVPRDSRVDIEVPAWARTICELSATLHGRPMRDGDLWRVDATTLSLPDRSRAMALLASSSPSGCTDGTAQDATRWPPTAERLAILTPSGTAFQEVERRRITIEDDAGQPIVGLPFVTGGRVAYAGQTDLDGTFVWWDEGGSPLTVGDGLEMPIMKAERWRLPASPPPPRGRPAAAAAVVGLWRAVDDAQAPHVHLSPEDVERGWALPSPTELLHIASTRRSTRVMACSGCTVPTRYEPVVPVAELSEERFVGGAMPTEPVRYGSTIERPRRHRVLPQDEGQGVETMAMTVPDALQQPGGPALLALSGVSFPKGERRAVRLRALGTTVAATVRYDGPEACGDGDRRCAALLMEIDGTFERWLVEPDPLRVHRIERRDARGAVVEALRVRWP